MTRASLNTRLLKKSVEYKFVVDLFKRKMLYFTKHVLNYIWYNSSSRSADAIAALIVAAELDRPIRHETGSEDLGCLPPNSREAVVR